MKKGLIYLLTMCSLLVACDDSDDDMKNSDEKVTEVQNIATDGQWRVTYFLDSDDDETSTFTGYIFEFDGSNNVTASNGSNNYMGTWSVTGDDDSDDDNDNDFDDIDFDINFGTPPDFAELSEDWEIVSMSSDKMELRHESGGNGGTDLLTFEKI